MQLNIHFMPRPNFKRKWILLNCTIVFTGDNSSETEDISFNGWADVHDQGPNPGNCLAVKPATGSKWISQRCHEEHLFVCQYGMLAKGTAVPAFKTKIAYLHTYIHAYIYTSIQIIAAVVLEGLGSKDNMVSTRVFI